MVVTYSLHFLPKLLPSKVALSVCKGCWECSLVARNYLSTLYGNMEILGAGVIDPFLAVSSCASLLNGVGLGPLKGDPLVI